VVQKEKRYLRDVQFTGGPLNRDMKIKVRDAIIENAGAYLRGEK
tara:strand:+ start:589 stop:720 length:132 start_codon:yes stop_codon:yes gene_type:complete